MAIVPQDCYWLVARDKPGLLSHMMRFLAGNAHISFEGNLSRCQFPDSIPRLAEQHSVLERNTIVPRQDFIILALESENIRPILESVLPQNRCMTDIIHIQIEKNRTLKFGTYDQFHHECIMCHLDIPAAFLEELKQKSVIKSWTLPYEGATR